LFRSKSFQTLKPDRSQIYLQVYLYWVSVFSIYFTGGKDMDLQLKGKSVLVNAASKGLGKAIAMEYVNEGANVLIGSSHEENLQQAVRDIKNATGKDHITYTVCDMKKKEDVSYMVRKMIDWTNRIDILINNAGGPPSGSFMTMDDDDWYHAFELNLLSFVRMIREVVPHMQKQKKGHIVNLASSSIKTTLDGLVLSNTMRPGILGLSKSLSQELGADNILINTVGPGTIETDRIAELNAKKAEQTNQSMDAIKEEAQKKIPVGRYGTPEEFAKAVV